MPKCLSESSPIGQPMITSSLYGYRPLQQTPSSLQLIELQCWTLVIALISQVLQILLQIRHRLVSGPLTRYHDGLEVRLEARFSLAIMVLANPSVPLGQLHSGIKISCQMRV